MTRFIQGTDRGQSTLLPECLDDWIDQSNSVRVIEAFVETLDLTAFGFDDIDPAATSRPGYHPSILLKLYIYGYLNRVQSSRRLEREAGRNDAPRTRSVALLDGNTKTYWRQHRSGSTTIRKPCGGVVRRSSIRSVR